ncbi:Ankyrin_repeat [Hexamita inflata]|uniref:Ankyrin repeat n=1 Tax=Hexamita inflata TaxID=28002 RepID=A0AA86QZD8_9EUKA|nr:Ankyrin repeat [Hexamita inflata]
MLKCCRCETYDLWFNSALNNNVQYIEQNLSGPMCGFYDTVTKYPRMAGFTALHYAILRGNVQIIKLLLPREADDTKNTCETTVIAFILQYQCQISFVICYTVVSEPTLILTNVYVIIALENQITVFMLIITYSINSAVHFFFTSSFK